MAALWLEVSALLLAAYHSQLLMQRCMLQVQLLCRTNIWRAVRHQAASSVQVDKHCCAATPPVHTPRTREAGCCVDQHEDGEAEGHGDVEQVGAAQEARAGLHCGGREA